MYTDTNSTEETRDSFLFFVFRFAREKNVLEKVENKFLQTHFEDCVKILFGGIRTNCFRKERQPSRQKKRRRNKGRKLLERGRGIRSSEVPDGAAGGSSGRTSECPLREVEREERER